MTAYYTLLTSLPKHGRQFKIKEPIISRIQLENRLTLLPEKEKNILFEIENVVWSSWIYQSLSFNETDIRAKKLFTLGNVFLNEMIEWYFNIRSILAALRLRNKQFSPPTEKFMHGPLNRRLINGWDKLDFGLEHLYPWILGVNQKIADNDIAGIENIVLFQLWRHLAIIEDRHYFDFEALIIYILRWNIVNYWSQFNETIAMQRISELADRLLNETTI